MASLNYGAMLKTLTEIASDMVEQAKTNASWSQDIPKAISFGQATTIQDGFQIDMMVDASRKGPAPQAAAFEFGSGIHAKNAGPEDTYVIAPVNAKALRFPFTLSFMPGKKLLGMLQGGRTISRKTIFNRMMNDPSGLISGEFLWSYVDHPGVEARPYMRPAIVAKLPEARQKINGTLKVMFGFNGVITEVIK